MRCSYALHALAIVALATSSIQAQSPKQPKVAPGPNEPDLEVVLRDRHGLSMFGDLRNPVQTTPGAVPGLFRKSGPGMVTYAPTIALGLETTNRGGYYAPRPSGTPPAKTELWSYTFKNTTADLEQNKNLPPALHAGSRTTFDPGDAPFGLWVSNDGLKDGGVFTEPNVVGEVNSRLAKQPYKAMIYPNRDKATGKLIPNSYIIGWEYSTNDDFQDVMCQVDNVVLIETRSPK